MHLRVKWKMTRDEDANWCFSKHPFYLFTSVASLYSSQKNIHMRRDLIGRTEQISPLLGIVRSWEAVKRLDFVLYVRDIGQSWLVKFYWMQNICMWCAWLAFKCESAGMIASFVYSSREICSKTRIERYSDLSSSVSRAKYSLQPRLILYNCSYFTAYHIFWQPIKYARNWLCSRVQYTCNLIAMHGIASFHL
jgi:hypothetical protein